MDNGLVRLLLGLFRLRIQVLILIVVDNGLVHGNNFSRTQWRYVLILVVVEDGLVLGLEKMLKQDVNVLILVVVDNGLVHSYMKVNVKFANGS